MCLRPERGSFLRVGWGGWRWYEIVIEYLSTLYLSVSSGIWQVLPCFPNDDYCCNTEDGQCSHVFLMSIIAAIAKMVRNIDCILLNLPPQQELTKAQCVYQSDSHNRNVKFRFIFNFHSPQTCLPNKYTHSKQSFLD